MSSWVHCNACYRKPGADVTFSLSNCGHVYCSSCLDKGVCKTKCPSCGHEEPKMVEANRSMPKKLQCYFKTAGNIEKEFFAKIKKTAEFQRINRSSIMRYHLRQADQFVKLRDFAKDQHKKGQEMKGQMTVMKTAYLKQRDELLDLKRKYDEATREPKIYVDPFKTPRGLRSFITSTPMTRDTTARTFNSTHEQSSNPELTLSFDPSESMASLAKMTMTMTTDHPSLPSIKNMKSGAAAGMRPMDALMAMSSNLRSINTSDRVESARAIKRMRVAEDLPLSSARGQTQRTPNSFKTPSASVKRRPTSTMPPSLKMARIKERTEASELRPSFVSIKKP